MEFTEPLPDFEKTVKEMVGGIAAQTRRLALSLARSCNEKARTEACRMHGERTPLAIALWAGEQTINAHLGRKEANYGPTLPSQCGIQKFDSGRGLCRSRIGLGGRAR